MPLKKARRKLQWAESAVLVDRRVPSHLIHKNMPEGKGQREVGNAKERELRNELLRREQQRLRPILRNLSNLSPQSHQDTKNHQANKNKKQNNLCFLVS